MIPKLDWWAPVHVIVNFERGATIVTRTKSPTLILDNSFVLLAHTFCTLHLCCASTAVDHNPSITSCISEKLSIICWWVTVITLVSSPIHTRKSTPFFDTRTVNSWRGSQFSISVIRCLSN